MQILTTITQKGQITLPKKVRNLTGIQEYSKVQIEVENDSIKITPRYDILDIAGSLKPKKRKSALGARKAFERNYSRT